VGWVGCLCCALKLCAAWYIQLVRRPFQTKYPLYPAQLKPDAAERRAIAALLRLSPTRPLPPDGKHLLWKFRFSLKSDAPALTKFLKCVDWNDAHETKQVRPAPQDP
jgi:hypothetical protein